MAQDAQTALVRLPATPESHFRRRSIAAQMTSIVFIFVGIVMVLLTVTAISSAVTTGVRAYVGGEGLWSKGQKDAVYSLTRYVSTIDEQDYRSYLAAIAIPRGDHAARLELEKPSYDYGAVERGFIDGGNAPGDVPYMIFLFRNFHRVPNLAKAIRIWTDADMYVARLTSVADELHVAVNSGALTTERAGRLLSQIEAVNEEVTPLEHEFSATLGEGSRWLRHVILVTIFSAAALLLGTGLWLSRRVVQHLRGGILRLRDGALRVARGDLGHRITLRSNDELGDLATVFNNMVTEMELANRKLQEEIARRIDTEKRLDVAVENLGRSNEELEQFAYVASHDLQAPIRAVVNFSHLLHKSHSQSLDGKGREFLGFIEDGGRQMHALITGLLEISRVGAVRRQDRVSMPAALEEAKNQLRSPISESKAEIQAGKLPYVLGDELQMRQLLQNLLGNAIKYVAPGMHPKIVLRTSDEGAWQHFVVEDNGIGIEAEHLKSVFAIFRRLHSPDRYPGAGIGLALCKKIVERHGGRIWIESVPGKGSCFHFTLPSAPDPACRGTVDRHAAGSWTGMARNTHERGAASLAAGEKDMRVRVQPLLA